MAADRLLHGVFEGPVGGGDRQEEAFGAQLPLRRRSLARPRLSASAQLGGGERVKEGDTGRGEEAAGGGLSGSCGQLEEVLQGDGTPTS